MLIIHKLWKKKREIDAVGPKAAVKKPVAAKRKTRAEALPAE